MNFSLAPPQIDSDGVPHYEIIRVIFDPTKLSADQLLKIIADASRLQVTVVSNDIVPIVYRLVGSRGIV